MTTVIPFTEPCIKNIQGCPALSGYIFENVFETKFYSLLENHVRNIVDLSSKNTFLTHNATFNINGQKVSLASNLHSAREQNVIFDLTFDSEYYYQTPDTIKDWSQYKITTTVSSIFQNALSTIQELPPIIHDTNGWIIYRCHINYLANLKYLGLHYDGNPMLVKTNTIKQARMLSLTYYLHDHKEGQGGELWSVNGFVYKPKKNSAIIFPGNKVLHGVTQNVNKDPRLAFTVRMMHKDDLYLPGHPSQWLYDVSGMSI